MKLHLIWAQSSNGIIGRNGTLPWHLPEDLAHFKRATLGSPVIMGRKTWDSLPPKFRPLPGRPNIVVTRQPHWQADGAQRAASLADAAALCSAEAVAWVIGGAEIYAQALPLAELALVTEINAPFDGDAYAPAFGPEWVETARAPQVAANGLAFSFVTYLKKQGH